HTRFSRDWSSDVCSSDLCDARIASRRRRASGTVAPARMHEAAHARLVGHAETVQLRDRGGRILVIEQFEGIEAAAGKEEHLVGEIGRASCRGTAEEAGRA